MRLISLFAEIDEEHFYKDVRTLDGAKYKSKVDCVAFGFPCQDYSISGKREGLEGQRGTPTQSYLKKGRHDDKEQRRVG